MQLRESCLFKQMETNNHETFETATLNFRVLECASV